MRSTAPSAVNGAGTSRHHAAPWPRRPLRRHAFVAANAAAPPSTRNTSRGSQVGSAVGANAALGHAQVRIDQASGSADPDHLEEKIDREHDQARPP